MVKLKRMKPGLFGSIALAAILVHASGLTAHAGNVASGELRIEGEHIKRLVLRNSRDERQEISPPRSPVILPVGQYRVEEITLEGDHQCWPHQIPADCRLAIDPNIPAILKAGAPLRQVIEVKRQGSTMLLAYELIGQGGERYSINQPQGSPTPSFAVYKGDRKLVSGDFEFG